MRTFEIPAIGGFMLAERGAGEYLEFFDEGEEIACFDDVADADTKIRYFLSHPDERERMAAAGRARALKSGYAYEDRVAAVLTVARECRGRA